jgi:RNA polymerase sigma factor (sigma-70 family)
MAPPTPAQPSDDPPTHDLVRAAQDDKALGFGALYERVAPAMHAWATLRIPSPLRTAIDPEDVVQEVWRRAFEIFDRYEPERAPFRAWVFRIANYVLMEALKKSRLRPPAAGGDDSGRTFLLHDVPAEATTVSRRVAADEAVRAFVREAATLPDDDRRLLIFHGLEGVKLVEVAERLGVAPDAARKRWERLRARLAEVAKRARMLDE